MTATWLQTASGMRFEYSKPDEKMVSLADIAHSLSRLCRFAGHVRGFWSVASHSVLVADIASDLAKEAGIDPVVAGYRGLLHDAAEAYVIDMPAPLKALLPEYKAIEERVEAAVRAYFGLPAPNVRDHFDVLVHKADRIALATEARDFMAKYRDEYMVGAQPISRRLKAEERDVAHDKFLRAFGFYSGNEKQAVGGAK
jgi:uncharacterized protein